MEVTLLGRVQVAGKTSAHDDTRMQAIRAKALLAELLSEGDGKEHVRGFGLAVGNPLLIRLAVLSPISTKVSPLFTRLLGLTSK